MAERIQPFELNDTFELLQVAEEVHRARICRGSFATPARILRSSYPSTPPLRRDDKNAQKMRFWSFCQGTGPFRNGPCSRLLVCSP